MRNRVIIICASFLVLLCAGFYSMRLVHRVSGDIKQGVDSMERLLSVQAWEQVQGELHALSQRFRAVNRLLEVFVCHDETDNIRLHLLLLEKCLEQRAHEEAGRNLVSLREAADHLVHRNSVSWSNIL